MQWNEIRLRPVPGLLVQLSRKALWNTNNVTKVVWYPGLCPYRFSVCALASEHEVTWKCLLLQSFLHSTDPLLSVAWPLPHHLRLPEDHADKTPLGSHKVSAWYQSCLAQPGKPVQRLSLSVLPPPFFCLSLLWSACLESKALLYLLFYRR